MPSLVPVSPQTPPRTRHPHFCAQSAEAFEALSLVGADQCKNSSTWMHQFTPNDSSRVGQVGQLAPPASFLIFSPQKSSEGHRP